MEESKISVKEEIVFNNPPQFILALVKLYQGSKQGLYELTHSELKFFVCMVLAYNEGNNDYKGSRFKKICNDLLGLKRDTDITTYLRKLQKNGWITYNIKDKTFELPDIFRNIDFRECEVEINVKLKYAITRSIN